MGGPDQHVAEVTEQTAFAILQTLNTEQKLAVRFIMEQQNRRAEALIEAAVNQARAQQAQFEEAKEAWVARQPAHPAPMQHEAPAEDPDVRITRIAAEVARSVIREHMSQGVTPNVTHPPSFVGTQAAPAMAPMPSAPYYNPSAPPVYPPAVGPWASGWRR